MPKICGASEKENYGTTNGKQGKINFLKDLDINDAFSTACHESIHIFDYNKHLVSLDIYDAVIKALKKQGYKTGKSIDTLKLDLLGYEYYNKYHKDEPELLAYSFEEYLYGSKNAFVVQAIEELRKRK